MEGTLEMFLMRGQNRKNETEGEKEINNLKSTKSGVKDRKKRRHIGSRFKKGKQAEKERNCGEHLEFLH